MAVLPAVLAQCRDEDRHVAVCLLCHHTVLLSVNRHSGSQVPPVLLDEAVELHPCIGRFVSFVALGTATANAAGGLDLLVGATATGIPLRGSMVNLITYLFSFTMSIFRKLRLVADGRDEFRTRKGC